jgi:hypothetical protein
MVSTIRAGSFDAKRSHARDRPNFAPAAGATAAEVTCCKGGLSLYTGVIAGRHSVCDDGSRCMPDVRRVCSDDGGQRPDTEIRMAALPARTWGLPTVRPSRAGSAHQRNANRPRDVCRFQYVYRVSMVESPLPRSTERLSRARTVAVGSVASFAGGLWCGREWFRQSSPQRESNVSKAVQKVI